MAQISLEEFYTGENAGKEYGIMNAVVADVLKNGVPSGYDENTWSEMLLVKYTLLAAEQLKKKGDFVTGITNTEPSSSSVGV